MAQKQFIDPLAAASDEIPAAVAQKYFGKDSDGALAQRLHTEHPETYYQIRERAQQLGLVGAAGYQTPEQRQAQYARANAPRQYTAEQIDAQKFFPREKVDVLYTQTNGKVEVDGKFYNLNELKKQYPALAEKARVAAISFGLFNERTGIKKPEPKADESTENRVKLSDDLAEFHGLEKGATVPASAVPALLREMGETARIAAIDKAAAADKTLQAAKQLHDDYVRRIEQAEAAAK